MQMCQLEGELLLWLTICSILNKDHHNRHSFLHLAMTFLNYQTITRCVCLIAVFLSNQFDSYQFDVTANEIRRSIPLSCLCKTDRAGVSRQSVQLRMRWKETANLVPHKDHSPQYIHPLNTIPCYALMPM